MHFAYLTVLLLTIFGLGLLDFRYKLAFFGGFLVRTSVILLISVGFFLVWDIVGITSGVFFRGSGPWMTGILVAPELPLEEILFLAVLSYSTLIVYLRSRKWAVERSLF